MFKKESRKKIFHILLIIVIFIVVDRLSDFYDSYQEKKVVQEQRDKLVGEFGENTVSYFEKVDCYDFKFSEKEFNIDKMITVDTRCRPQLNYYGYGELKGYFTKVIDSANTILKISSHMPGKIENECYQRYKTRVTFINKKTLEVWKIIYIDYLGDVPKKDRFCEGSKKISFGSMPDSKTIYKSILEVVKTKK